MRGWKEVMSTVLLIFFYQKHSVTIIHGNPEKSRHIYCLGVMYSRQREKGGETQIHR
jgi:hypothetical protein